MAETASMIVAWATCCPKVAALLDSESGSDSVQASPLTTDAYPTDRGQCTHESRRNVAFADSYIEETLDG